MGTSAYFPYLLITLVIIIALFYLLTVNMAKRKELDLILLNLQADETTLDKQIAQLGENELSTTEAGRELLQLLHSNNIVQEHKKKSFTISLDRPKVATVLLAVCFTAFAIILGISDTMKQQKDIAVALQEQMNIHNSLETSQAEMQRYNETQQAVLAYFLQGTREPDEDFQAMATLAVVQAQKSNNEAQAIVLEHQLIQKQAELTELKRRQMFSLITIIGASGFLLLILVAGVLVPIFRSIQIRGRVIDK